MRSEQRNALTRLFRERTQPLPQVPTPYSTTLASVRHPIRAVVFDVYGTLIRSGVGDISLDQCPDQDGLIRDLVEKPGVSLRHHPQDLAAELQEEIKRNHQRAKGHGIPYPEVEIREIWSTLMARWSNPPLPLDWQSQRIASLAVEYELSVNPVWPNLGFPEILTICREAGCRLGIVSNAQFYTPIMLEAFLEQPLESAGFDPLLQIWSYQEGRGKPDPLLYEKLALRLEDRYQIHRGEVLYVGNDMLKDVWAATEAGFRGVWYAGDARSARKRDDDLRCQGVTPYATITELTELTELLPCP